MTAVFHEKYYITFLETKGNILRKKLHRTNQGSLFLGGSFSNRDNVRFQIQFRREKPAEHPKR